MPLTLTWPYCLSCRGKFALFSAILGGLSAKRRRELWSIFGRSSAGQKVKFSQVFPHELPVIRQQVCRSWPISGQPVELIRRGVEPLRVVLGFERLRVGGQP